MSLFRRFSKVQQSGQLPSNHSNLYPAPIERGYTRGIFHRTGSVRMLCSSPKRKRWKYWNTKVALRLQYVLVAYIGYKLGTAIFTYTSPTQLQLEKEMKGYFEDSVDVIHIMEEAVVDVAFVTNNDEEFIAKVRRDIFDQVLHLVRHWNSVRKSEEGRLEYVHTTLIPEFLMTLSYNNDTTLEIFVNRKKIYDDLVRITREIRPDLLSSNQDFAEDLRKLAIKLSEMDSTYNAQAQVEMLVDSYSNSRT
eukprot:809077_1